MAQLSPENAAYIAKLAVNQAEKARKAWEDARDAAFELAEQAIELGVDRDEVIRPLVGICTHEQIGELAMLALGVR